MKKLTIQILCHNIHKPKNIPSFIIAQTEKKWFQFLSYYLLKKKKKKKKHRGSSKQFH